MSPKSVLLHELFVTLYTVDLDVCSYLLPVLVGSSLSLHTCLRAQPAQSSTAICSGHPPHRQTNPTLSDAGSSVAVSCFGLHAANPQPIISAWGNRCVCLVFKVMKSVFSGWMVPQKNYFVYSWIKKERKLRDCNDVLVVWYICNIGHGHFAIVHESHENAKDPTNKCSMSCQSLILFLFAIELLSFPKLLKSQMRHPVTHYILFRVNLTYTVLLP